MKWLTSQSLDDSGSQKRLSVALLFIRVAMGVAMMIHGWPKIQNGFSWMGPEAPVPGIFQFLAALSEFGGGLALVLGLLTSLSSIGLLCTMSVAALVHIQKGDPFVGKNGSWELAGIYWVLSLLFLLTGPGYFSLDSKIFKK